MRVNFKMYRLVLILLAVCGDPTCINKHIIPYISLAPKKPCI